MTTRVIDIGLLNPLRLVASLMSLRYFALRASTATAALVSGLIQTFVFARVLTPDDFSIFILIGTFGFSLWLFDLGAAKILFVRQRERHLSHGTDDAIAAQSSAVIAVYLLIAAIGTALCFLAMLARPSTSAWQALEFALFFSFSALNLVWFPLRNISNAIDAFITFETLEAARRIAHIAVLLSLLIGIPMMVFLITANLIWAALMSVCIRHLLRRGALSWRPRLFWRSLTQFWRGNRREILRSGNYSIGELLIYNFPYLVVPAAFGLGAPTIILDTVFKIFRGATLIYAAGLDPLIPRQTRAFAERDAATLLRATTMAGVLCAIPTFILCALLLFAGDRLFAILLGHAAVVPREITLILVALLIANLVQNVANCLLQHTGFFREMARVATFLVVAMAAMTGVTLTAGLGMAGFLAGYTIVYVAGALLYVAYVVRGPFRVAANAKVAPR